MLYDSNDKKSVQTILPVQQSRSSSTAQAPHASTATACFVLAIALHGGRLGGRRNGPRLHADKGNKVQMSHGMTQ